MRRRAIAWTLGATVFLGGAGIFAYERSGIGSGARGYRATVAAARRAGIEPDGNRLVAEESRHVHDRAKRAYDAALVRFSKRIPAGFRARKSSAAQRAALRSDIERLVPLSLAASGGTAREWRAGVWLRFPEYSGYRAAVGVLARDAVEARRRGDLRAAIRDLALAERLGHGMIGNAEILGELVLITASRTLGDELAALLEEKALDSPMVRELTRIVDGPTFRHGDDRRVLSHRLASDLATVDELIAMPPADALRSGSRDDRYLPLGRVGAVRESWLGAVVRPYADVGAALPRDWTDFERYEAA